LRLSVIFAPVACSPISRHSRITTKNFILVAPSSTIRTGRAAESPIVVRIRAPTTEPFSIRFVSQLSHYSERRDVSVITVDFGTA
jgi:hypothetical protein